MPRIKDEYRLIHPNKIFSTLLEIFKEYTSDITVEKSVSEEHFHGTITSVIAPPRIQEKTKIYAKVQGKKKKWEKFEPFGKVWRCTVTINGFNNQCFLEELKDKIFQRTLRGGG